LTATLKELLQKTQDAAFNQGETAQNSIGPSHSPAPSKPRGYASPQDVYDTEVGYDSPFMNFAPGTRRQMWQLPDVALTHTPVNTLTTSASVQGTQATQISGGAQSSVKAATGWSTVPNMELNLIVNGPNHLTATVPVQSTTASDPVQFAFYRGRKPLSQIFQHTTHANINTPTLVTIAMVDTSVMLHAPLNYETYSVYWKGASGNVSSPGVGRSFFLTSLIPT